jgi:hypothetical protein
MKKESAKKRKSPFLTAFLNLIWTGLGYIYVGKRVMFGVCFAIWNAVFLTIMIMTPLPYTAWVFLSVDSSILSLLFAYDGYRTAEEVNRQ